MKWFLLVSFLSINVLATDIIITPPVVYTQAELATQAMLRAAADLEEQNIPIVYKQPIEIPALVLQSLTNAVGIGYVAADDGTLISFEYHASPVPSAKEISLRKAASLAKYYQKKNKALSDLNGQLQVRIENLERLLGLRE